MYNKLVSIQNLQGRFLSTSKPLLQLNYNYFQLFDKIMPKIHDILLTFIVYLPEFVKQECNKIGENVVLIVTLWIN